MCGIVGYIGHQEACPILIKGLHRLEYRGYDSSGVALINNSGNINLYKCKGKVSNLEELTQRNETKGVIGIAHTRWATHGEPNDINSHPHLAQSGNLALVHNGIIENYTILKEALIEQGYSFKSETDTEVLVNLIDYIQTKNKCSIEEAVRHALNQVIGAYAIAIIEKNNPNKIIAARKSSPLVIGIGEKEFFIASDATPIIEYTKDVVYLNDNEIAIICQDQPLKVVNLENINSNFNVSHLEMSIHELEKEGYPHFMLKEIYKQPSTLKDCIRGRILTENSPEVIISGIKEHKDRFLNARRIIFVACGTSWHASLIGEHLFEDFCRIPVEVEYASEFRYRNPIINKDDVVIAVSQSGETADTLAAIELAKEAGAFVYGVCNVIGSSIARASDSGTYIHVGPEIGVASTKAFTGQITVLSMLALMLAKEKNSIAKEDYQKKVKCLASLPSLIEEVLKTDAQIKELAKIFTYAQNFLYLGRGYNYPSALEGALKLKEISYIHAEGYPAAEMKHGPIALIDTDLPVVVIATKDTTYEKTISNIQEIKARGAKIIAVVDKGDNVICNMADYCIEVPVIEEFLKPILVSIPLQLLAYHIACIKGKNVDMPRNLAKSVTVE